MALAALAVGACAAALPDEMHVDGLGRVKASVATKGSEVEGNSADWYQWVMDASVNAFSRPGEVPQNHALPKARALSELKRLLRADTGVLWIGHSTFLVRIGGVNVLTDPVFSEYTSPMPPSGPKRYVPPALEIDELPRIDLIIVSHAHYDHLDRASLQQIGARFPEAELLVPAGAQGYVADTGFRRIFGVNPGDVSTIGTLTARALPAYHVASRTGLDAGSTRSLSFSLRSAGGRSIYFAGDTAYGPVFRRIRSAFGSHEVALVPIGAYAPRRNVRHVHVTPEEAGMLASDLGARLAVAMHWGTFPLSVEPVMEPPRRFLAGKVPARRVLRIGEALTLAPDASRMAAGR